MSDLVINISWEYFLGFIGSSILLAYYANGRFTRLETDVQMLAELVKAGLVSIRFGTSGESALWARFAPHRSAAFSYSPRLAGLLQRGGRFYSVSQRARHRRSTQLAPSSAEPAASSATNGT